MRTLLATCLLVCFAVPAASQISAGPLGPFALVDDNGKLIGGLVPGGPGSNAWFVALDSPVGSYAVTVTAVGGAIGQFQTQPIYFTTTNCTGQAYRVNYVTYGTSWPIDAGTTLAISHNKILYAVAGPEISAAMASSFDSSGVCQSNQGSTNDFVPVNEIGDLATEFTPPFHIVTADSQMAAVPLQFGWLLGGVLLGLGIKAVGRRR